MFYKSIRFTQLNKDPSIFIQKSKEKISIISVCVDDSFLVFNTIVIFNALKKSFTKKYDIKNLDEVKTIIGWQISRDTAIGTIKINQSVFIRDLVIEEEFANYNANVIPIKARL